MDRNIPNTRRFSRNRLWLMTQRSPVRGVNISHGNCWQHTATFNTLRGEAVTLADVAEVSSKARMFSTFHKYFIITYWDQGSVASANLDRRLQRIQAIVSARRK